MGFHIRWGRSNIMVIKSKLYKLLLLMWIIVIFAFSLQPAGMSTETSTGLLVFIVKKMSMFFGNSIEVFMVENVKLLQGLIRKCAHFIEFYILGTLTALSLNSVRLKNKIMYGFTFSVLIAIIDETIQRFVPGRSGQISDVVLDSVGALVGICCIILLIKRKRSIVRTFP